MITIDWKLYIVYGFQFKITASFPVGSEENFQIVKDGKKDIEWNTWDTMYQWFL